MEFFSLFEVPVSFSPDADQVRKQYFILSRKYHPDFHAQSSPEEQSNVLQLSSMVNEGYRTLLNKDLLIRYILKEKGLVEDEEKYQLDPAFLGEVMEINEQLMEAEMGEDVAVLEQVEKETNALETKIYSDVEPVMANYKEGAGAEKELLRVKEYFYRKKYLRRILDKIASMRNIASL